MVAYSAISPAYLRTLKTPLLAGREFDDHDITNAPQVAIINETMATLRNNLIEEIRTVQGVRRTETRMVLKKYNGNNR